MQIYPSRERSLPLFGALADETQQDIQNFRGGTFLASCQSFRLPVHRVSLLLSRDGAFDYFSTLGASSRADRSFHTGVSAST